MPIAFCLMPLSKHDAKIQKGYGASYKFSSIQYLKAKGQRLKSQQPKANSQLLALFRIFASS
jgi:hypothetical protein